VNLNLQGFVGNLISVTTGNIIGGGFMVAVVHWFIYRPPQEANSRVAAKTAFRPFLSTRQPGNPAKQS
jgi:hypothetical protein